MFDRLGAAHEISVGYRATRDLIFEIGNLFIASMREPDPDSWRKEPKPSEAGGAPEADQRQLAATRKPARMESL
jgi:nitrogenase molybdenum-iron protein NifN